MNFEDIRVNDLMSITSISEYIENNVKEKIKFFAKSLIQGFNCGYNTSSISESFNRKIKNLHPNRSVSLKEIRIILKKAEGYSGELRRFVKGCKMHKLHSPLIIKNYLILTLQKTVHMQMQVQ